MDVAAASAGGPTETTYRQVQSALHAEWVAFLKDRPASSQLAKAFLVSRNSTADTRTRQKGCREGCEKECCPKEHLASTLRNIRDSLSAFPGRPDAETNWWQQQPVKAYLNDVASRQRKALRQGQQAVPIFREDAEAIAAQFERAHTQAARSNDMYAMVTNAQAWLAFVLDVAMQRRAKDVLEIARDELFFVKLKDGRIRIFANVVGQKIAASKCLVTADQSPMANDPLCPLRAIDTYFQDCECVGIEFGKEAGQSEFLFPLIVKGPEGWPILSAGLTRHKRKPACAFASGGQCDCPVEALPRLGTGPVNAILKKMAKAAGLEHHEYSFHGTRAGTIMVSLADGMPPALVADASGHTDVEQLKRYARLNQQIADMQWHPHDTATYQELLDAPQLSSWSSDLEATKSCAL